MFLPITGHPQKNAISNTQNKAIRLLFSRLRLKCDGTRWRTGGEVKGKEENGVGNQ